MGLDTFFIGLFLIFIILKELNEYVCENLGKLAVSTENHASSCYFSLRIINHSRINSS